MSICQIYDLCAETLWLGRYNENGARDIAIDVGKWFADLGAEGTVVLVNWRPGEDDTPYNPNITMDGSKVVWSPSNIDLAISGRGFAELRYYVGNVLAKSKTFRTVIDRTPSEGANPPSAAEDWLERMEDAAVTAQTASETAVTAAETATEGAQAVAQALPTVTQAAQTATTAATTATNAATEAAASEEVASVAANAAQSASETATAASQTAVSSASTATAKAAQAVEAAGTATTKASEATQAATTATANAQTSTAKAGEATTAAATATSKATEATTAASTASAAATTATSAASTATSAASTATAAKTAAETAQTGAETAQGAAEAAAASVSASASQIATNTSDITELKADFSELPTDGVTANAKQLLSNNGTDNTEPYMFRAVPVNADREEVNAVVGGTVAWNQLNDNSRESTTNAGVAFTNNQDGSWTLNGTTDSDNSKLFSSVFNLGNGHVYYVKGCPSGGGASTYFFGIGGIRIDNGNGGIWKNSANYAVGTATFVFMNGVTFSNVTIYPVIVDLTAMFGSTIADYIYSLETATPGAGVAFFRKYYPADYYPYDAGTLKSVEGVSAHETVGFNVFDGQLEVGGINDSTGQPIVVASQKRSVNFIPVVPDTIYYAHTPYFGTGGLWIYFYDADKNYVGRATVYGLTSTDVREARFLTSSDCRFIKFKAQATISYDDICINLSDPAKNGTYEPYVKHSYALDPTVVLRGIPKLAEGKLYYDGDRYLPDGTVERRYGIVNLGTLDWITAEGRNDFWTYLPTGGKIYPTNVTANWICDKYLVTTSVTYVNWNDKPDMVIGCRANNGYIHIRDSKYTDVASFKSALSGVLLVYELATPATETAEPYQSLQVCDPNGTEEYVSTGIVPVGHETRYPENLRAKIEGLPWDFSTLIAPTETGTASRNYTVGSLLIMSNVLYKVTANIANGGTITPGTNVTATTLSEVISALS